MTKSFNRALVFTDLHFGKKSNSKQFNQDCLEFVDWATKLGQDHNCDRLIFAGDWHDHRASINLHTLNYSIRALELINSRFKRADFIVGNHDLYYRDNRSIASNTWANYIPNINIHTEILHDGDLVFVPWLVGDEYKILKKIKAKHMFGHFELPKFKMNSMVEMPEHGNINADDFNKTEFVWTGHFHKRQSRENITYIGNAFPHDYADAWDDERGAMILDWDGTHEFHAWANAPKYRTINLSQLLDNPEFYITKNSYLRVTIDIPISYEESNFIKETFIQQYQPREIALLVQNQEREFTTTPTDIKFESVDQIVFNKLTTLDSDFYDKKILMDIYGAL